MKAGDKSIFFLVWPRECWCWVHGEELGFSDGFIQRRISCVRCSPTDLVLEHRDTAAEPRVDLTLKSSCQEERLTMAHRPVYQMISDRGKYHQGMNRVGT